MNQYNGSLFKVPVSAAEFKAGCLEDETHSRAMDIFRQQGALWLAGCFDRELIQQVADACTEKYLSLGKKELRKRDAIVGDRRYMITVDIKKPFNDPRLYANPILLSLLHKLLSPHCRIASFGIVSASPGADEQPIHLDHPPLFDDPATNDGIPPYAITVVIPLVSLIPEMGTTAIWPGSHRSADRLEMLKQLMEAPDYAAAHHPLASLGDAYLMDYRLIHGGRANESDHVRPILYSVYSRPWFRDGFNFGSQPAVQISKKQIKKVPKEHRGLFRP